MAEWCGGVLTAPSPAGWPALRRPGAREEQRRLGAGTGRWRLVKVTDSRGRWPGGPTSGGRCWPGGRRRRAIEDQENNMSRRNLRKLTAAEAAWLARLSDSVDLCWPLVLLNLGQI